MRTLLVITVSVLLVGCQEGTPGPGTAEADPARPQFEDPDVQRIHDRMMGVVAPDRGWERTRYLAFDWGVRRADAEPIIRSHRWDRWEGRARVESPAEEGTLVAIFDVDAPEEGRVWVNGEELAGEEAAERLRSAHRAHVNDTYWLVMPYKWADPGVRARYLGEQTDDDGSTWEVVELTFEQDVGLTPQNIYHAFVNPETGRMERWHHYSNPDANPSPTDWTDWTRIGAIELALNREANGEVRLFFSDVRAETEVPPGAFDPPGE
jgi:hypothetical protein